MFSENIICEGDNVIMLILIYKLLAKLEILISSKKQNRRHY